MTQKQIKNRIQELACSHGVEYQQKFYKTTREDCNRCQRRIRLEQLYDDLYGTN